MDNIVYNKIKPRPIFEEVIHQIRNRISTGVLKPGDLLPPERQLAEMMGVNRHTLREGLKILEFIGVVQSRTGVGTIVNNLGQDILVERISHAPQYSPRRFLFELMELRQAIEPHAASLAAKRAGKSDWEEMERAMADLTAETRGELRESDGDERLHLAIARATHNETFFRLTQPIMEMLADYRRNSFRVPGRRKEIQKEHERIFQALKSRDSEKAESAMSDHLKMVLTMLNTVEGAEQLE